MRESKSKELLVKEGRQLRRYRETIGLSGTETARRLETNQGNFSAMERGQRNSGWRLNTVRGWFKEWRKGEIKRLEDRIKYLKTL